MISGLDPLGGVLRHDPLPVDGRGVLIEAEPARLLGLRNHQIVQAVVTSGPSGLLVQWPPGLREGLPIALQAFPLPSSWRWAGPGTTLDLLPVLMPGGQMMLRASRAGIAGANPGAPGAGAGDGAVGAGAGAAAAGAGAASAASALAARAASVDGASRAPEAEAARLGDAPSAPRYTLGQAFAAAQATPAAAGGLAGEVSRLLGQSPGWLGFLSLLQGLVQGSTPGLAPALRPGMMGLPPPEGEGLEGGAGAEADDGAPAPALGTALRLPLFRMAGLNAETLRQAVMRSGLGTEAALLGNGGWVGDDLKVALRRLLRQPGAAAAGLESALRGAVDDLERSQLDSLSAQMQGQLLLSMVIPFGDAGPVALRFFRERQADDQPPAPFIIDIHTRHSGLGPLWLRTAVSDETRLSLTMWAEWPEVAQLARERVRDLRWTLTCSGLRLEQLEIHEGPPPAQDDPFGGAS